MSEVIDFRKLPKLKPITEYPRKLNLEPREVTMDSPVVPMLRDTLKSLQQRDERMAVGAEARQCIARGVALLREAEGDEAADKWLVQCMSVIGTVR